AQRATPQGVASDGARSAHDAGPAGEPEAALQVLLLRRHGREQVGALLHLDQALAALPLLDAGRGNSNAFGLRALAQALAGAGRHAMTVDGEGQGGHGLGHRGAHRPAAALATSTASSRLNSSTALAASAA